MKYIGKWRKRNHFCPHAHDAVLPTDRKKVPVINTYTYISQF
jgi:hypothetical protein